jgi:hypothetical protein
LPSASRGSRDSTPRSSNDGSDSTPPASISSGTSIAATAASAAASRPETDSLCKATVAPGGTETASSFRFTCRPFVGTISHVPAAPCHLIEQFEPPGRVIRGQRGRAASLGLRGSTLLVDVGEALVD